MCKSLSVIQIGNDVFQIVLILGQVPPELIFAHYISVHWTAQGDFITVTQKKHSTHDTGGPISGLQLVFYLSLKNAMYPCTFFVRAFQLVH